MPSVVSLRCTWTLEEDAGLLKAVNKHGAKSWAAVSTHIKGRTGKQCRERWAASLRPGANSQRKDWTAAEDKKLQAAYAKYGGKWDRIAAALGRNETIVRLRWPAFRKDGTASKKGSIESSPSAASSQTKRPISSPDAEPAATAPASFYEQLASPRIRGDYAVPKRRHLAAQDAAAHAGSGGSSSRRSSLHGLPSNDVLDLVPQPPVWRDAFGSSGGRFCPVDSLVEKQGSGTKPPNGRRLSDVASRAGSSSAGGGGGGSDQALTGLFASNIGLGRRRWSMEGSTNAESSESDEDEDEERRLGGGRGKGVGGPAGNKENILNMALTVATTYCPEDEAFLYPRGPVMLNSVTPASFGDNVLRDRMQVQPDDPPSLIARNGPLECPAERNTLSPSAWLDHDSNTAATAAPMDVQRSAAGAAVLPEEATAKQLRLHQQAAVHRDLLYHLFFKDASTAQPATVVVSPGR